ncbi:MAG TPA: chemotaxis protein CheA [Kofleriaceae bacterium]|nr:chemotaxis protein CheA [Kofleriaceae bacterium]
MTDDLNDVVREFLSESRENLDQIDVDLVTLEKNPEDGSIVARIFRTIHTIKGTCGFLGFSRLEAVSHAGENVLSALRDEEIAPTPTMTTVLLSMVDVIRGLLAQIDATGEEGEGDHGVLIHQLTELYHGRTPSLDASPAAVESAPAASEPPSDAAEPPPSSPDPIEPVAAAPPAPPAATATPAPPAAAAMLAASATPATPPAALPVPVLEPSAPASEAAGETSIRVDVALLDKLMNLVGELVLARNQIIQFTGSNGDATFLGATQQLNLITSELQEGVMKTRMQPIGNIWNKYPRVVRDLARSCDKRVELVMEGESTELDKTLIEAIKDPLTHLVRNAIDHGIEAPERRAEAGKPPQGRLLLRAFHEGGQVNIEVTDDGAGLDAERIRDKAIERGIITADQAARMSERDLFRLVFLPGFSTAARITNVSGRGVGMDVVRTNIERIGGTIDLQGTRGAGTTIKIKIPLTLAIIPALVVASGDNRYAIPQASLLELVRLEGDEARHGVELLYGAPVYRLRGKLLPLVYLSDALQDATPRTDEAEVNIVVLQADDRQFGLVVQSVHDTEEIVVKPLGKHLKGTPLFAGATIMGDGRVALILDILGLAKQARVVAEGHERARMDLPLTAPVGDRDDQQTMLVFRSPDDGRMAIPLSRVARLEELAPSMLERVGGELLVQYRGEIMPVVELSSVVVERRGTPRRDAQPAPSDGLIQVVVFSHRGAHVGLIVDQILDIVEDTLANPRPPGRRGVLGSVVIAGRVTELLDVGAVLEYAQPPTTWAERAEPAIASEEAGHVA